MRNKETMFTIFITVTLHESLSKQTHTSLMNSYLAQATKVWETKVHWEYIHLYGFILYEWDADNISLWFVEDTLNHKSYFEYFQMGVDWDKHLNPIRVNFGRKPVFCDLSHCKLTSTMMGSSEDTFTHGKKMNRLLTSQFRWSRTWTECEYKVILWEVRWSHISL